jgi:hypothetical protein
LPESNTDGVRLDRFVKDLLIVQMQRRLLVKDAEVVLRFRKQVMKALEPPNKKFSPFTMKPNVNTVCLARNMLKAY